LSYQLAIEKAGAEILLYKQFGSYQGDWLAKVIYEGKQMWIHGAYGSCSGCDSFQAEFDNCSHDCPIGGDCFDPLWNDNFHKCNECLTILNRLIEFGLHYLYNNAYTQEEIEAQFKAKDWGDYEEMLEYITKNAITEKVS